MWRYIAAIALIAAPSFYVSIQYKHHAPSANCQTTQPVANTLPAPANEKAKSDICQSEWHPPSWYRLFGWESLQTWGLFLTLIVIADQTQQTSRAAAAATEASLALITRQADLMKEQSDLTVSKERAKLRINLYSFDPFQDVGDTKAYLVRGSVSIYGFSEAFIDGNKIYVALGKAGIEDPLPEWHWSMRLPPVIRQNDPPIQFTALLNGNEGPVTEDEIAEVIDCSVKIYCVAYIEFSDVYGRKWIQRLKQRHTFNNWPPLDSEMAVRMGRWENIGLPSDNGEYAQD